MVRTLGRGLMRSVSPASSKAKCTGAPAGIPGSIALIVLLTLGLAATLSVVGCGGGGGTTSSISGPTGGGGGGGGGPMAACAGGTVSTYISSGCSQGSTVYSFTSYTCTSNPATLCSGLGVKGLNLGMKPDPNGTNTLLVGDTSTWNVTAGESVDVVISGTVYGATANQNWPHFHGIPGQTGDGTEENITTVGCAASGNCLDPNNGKSDILCSASSPIANCTDQSSSSFYNAYIARFNAAPASSPYTLTIEIKLNGGTNGTASLFSVGTHLGNK